MRALYTTAPGEYGLADRPDPRPAPDEVVLRVDSAGFCYNDLRIRSGVLTEMGFPFVPGHQFAGVVQECGPGVKYTRPGARVAVHSYVLCGMCASCRTGGTHDCERFQALGFTLDGGLAQYAAAPERCLFELPDHVDLEQGALLENLANAAAAIRRLRLGLTERVLVIGATPIGLLAVQVARLHSPRALVVAGAGEGRLAVGAALGATGTVEVRSADVVEQVRGALGGDADAVLLCGYARRDFELAMDAVGSTGRVLVEGHYDPLVTVTFAPRDLVAKNATMVPNTGWSTPDYQQALDLVSRGMVDVKAVITHRYPLERWEAAFDLFADVDGGALHVCIEPNGAS